MSTPTSAVHVVDSVANAIATPDREQPYAALGLTGDEYARIREILGRRPTSGELAMYSVMWSEHCSYKSSKNYLRQFGSKTTEKMRKNLMVGIGENAGVLDIGDGWAVTFKVESHNHPSFIEPFQGAATGVGGIVRDIIAMGARPVAVMDQLRFGAIDHPDTARVVQRRRVRDQLLRQLPGPAEHRRGDLLRPVLSGQPARQRAGGRGAAPRGPAPGQRARARATRSCCSARAPAATASAGHPFSPARPFPLRRSGTVPDQAPGGAGGRPVRREGAHRVLPRAVRRRPGRGHPGPRRRRHQLRHLGAGGGRRRRHADRARPGAAARPDASPPRKS